MTAVQKKIEQKVINNAVELGLLSVDDETHNYCSEFSKPIIIDTNGSFIHFVFQFHANSALISF